jgi:O-antigen/teichoic acid export membrane protein
VLFVSTMVLARLLTPEMFGLVAMANVALMLMASLRDVGLGAAYVQREMGSPEELRLAANTTFFLMLFTNAMLFVLAASLAPLAGRFFENPEVVPLLRAITLIFLLDGLISGPSMVLRRRLDFRRLAYAEIGASLASATVAISLAILGFKAWSLVWGQVAGRVVEGSALYWLSGWRPRFEFSSKLARELFGFGKHLWGFSILSAVGGVLDRAIVGRTLGAASLGIYHMGSNLANLPAQQISFLVNRITFPALARMQGDPARMAAALRKALAHVSIVTLPVTAGLIVAGPQLIGTVYGPRWEAAVPVLQVLALFGMTLSISSVTGPIFQAMGRPQVLLFTSIFHQLVYVGLLLWWGRYGIQGILWAVVVPVQLSAVIAFVLVLRYLKVSFVWIFGPCLRAATAAVGMFAALWMVRLFLEATQLLLPIQLVVLAILGVAIYVGLSFLFNGVASREFLDTLRKTIRPDSAEEAAA